MRKNEAKKEREETAPEGLLLIEVAEQVLLKPLKDWRPAGPTMEEYWARRLAAEREEEAENG